MKLPMQSREFDIQRLMSINLLKRLESSVHPSNLTLERILTLIKKTIASIDEYEKYGHTDVDMYQAEDSDLDMDDGNTDVFTIGKKVKIDLADMDYKTWST